MNEQKHLTFHGPTWRLRTLRLDAASLLALTAAIATGCSGINASKSVSPLDFFLPGLMQNMPPAPAIPSANNALAELAQASHYWLSMQTQPNSSL